MTTVTTPQIEQPGREDNDVEIEVNYHKVRVPRETNGSQIKQAAHLGADYELYRIHAEDEIRIGDDEAITVHSGERFVAAPGLEPA
jgi:hypothetical protein